MRTNLTGMEDSEEPRDNPDEPEEIPDSDQRDEGYETKGGDFVIFDSRNPVAWIKSSLWGVPADQAEPVDRDRDPDDHEAQPEDDADE